MLAAILVAATTQSPTLSLERGGPGDSDFRYYAVSDTFIESTKPVENYGRDPLLSGGPGKSILIKFGDLRRIIGPNRVTRARLILSQEIGDEPQLSGVYRMVTPWGEGPGRRGLGLLETPIEPGAKAPNVSATWDSPLGGKAYGRWQAPGGKGLADREEVKGANSVLNDRVLVIDGLGPAVQAMADNPAANHGFGLDFRNAVDFSSSEAATGRPILQVETAPAPLYDRESNLQMLYVSCSKDLATVTPNPGEDLTWTAHFMYHGTQSGAIRVSWMVAGQEIISEFPAGLSDGQEGTVTTTWPWQSKGTDHRTRSVVVKAEMGPVDTDRSDNVISFYEAARPVILPDTGNKASYARAAQFLNDVALPFSRFSFALDGVRTGVRIQDFKGPGTMEVKTLRQTAREILIRAGVLDLGRMQVGASSGADRLSTDPYPGITNGGDTRNDTGYPGIMGFPAEPWFDAATAQLRFEATDLLAATEAAALHCLMTPYGQIAEQTPKNTVVRVIDSNGQLIKGARLEFYSRKGGKFEGVPTFTIENIEGGIAPLPNQGRTPFPDFDDGVLMVRVSRDGVSATGFLKSWQIVDSFARGNVTSGIVPLQVPLPAGKASETNLAEGRIITDSLDTLPTKLDSLIDGKTTTTYDWAAGKAGWIELDLGKDRALGKVELQFAGAKCWPAFNINVFSTGQKPEAARTWAHEINGLWMLINRGENGAISYYGTPTQARYIRIEIPANNSGASLAEWRVFGLE